MKITHVTFAFLVLAASAAAVAPVTPAEADLHGLAPVELSATVDCDVPLLAPTEEAPCGGIRPGGPLTGPSGNGAFCTLAWALTDGTDLYMTTAGHCVGTGQRVGTQGVGAFGTVVYSFCGYTPLFETCEPGYDYALIRVDADKRDLVSNELCGWSAPSAVFEEYDLVPRVVMHHGYGLGTGTFDETRARAGVSSVLDDSRKFGFFGAASFGDSGSAAAVRADAVSGDVNALGIITHIVAYTEEDPDPVRDGTVTGTRLDAAVADLEAALGIDLELL